ncbi:hypothetical protein J2S55_009336 [Streptosporangium brasiliense]|uniref:Uncharacterized protein n=1 Tax=Streptosporangium brasiliense TaxID=47480 RepID=A0ABT9RNX2_9ACTN|nr:hypothetical protein [Streptosporangium brasiliense]
MPPTARHRYPWSVTDAVNVPGAEAGDLAERVIRARGILRRSSGPVRKGVPHPEACCQ